MCKNQRHSTALVCTCQESSSRLLLNCSSFPTERRGDGAFTAWSTCRAPSFKAKAFRMEEHARVSLETLTDLLQRGMVKPFRATKLPRNWILLHLRWYKLMHETSGKKCSKFEVIRRNGNGFICMACTQFEEVWHALLVSYFDKKSCSLHNVAMYNFNAGLKMLVIKFRNAYVKRLFLQKFESYFAW